MKLTTSVNNRVELKPLKNCNLPVGTKLLIEPLGMYLALFQIQVENTCIGVIEGGGPTLLSNIVDREIIQVQVRDSNENPVIYQHPKYREIKELLSKGPRGMRLAEELINKTQK